MNFSDADKRSHEKMMTEGDALPVQVTSNFDNHLTSFGVVRIKTFSDSERLKRAVWALVVCWVIAVVSILLPLAHFVLVPGFFIAGIVAPTFRYRVLSLVLGGEYKCPKCQANAWIQANTNEWPQNEICSECGENVEIKPLENIGFVPRQNVDLDEEDS